MVLQVVEELVSNVIVLELLLYFGARFAGALVAHADVMVVWSCRWSRSW